MAGGSVRVTCRVPLHPDHRKMAYGILFDDGGPDAFNSEERDIQGEAGPITFERLIQHVPCDAGDAFCTVTDAYGRARRVVSHLEVVCSGDAVSGRGH